MSLLRFGWQWCLSSCLQGTSPLEELVKLYRSRGFPSVTFAVCMCLKVAKRQKECLDLEASLQASQLCCFHFLCLQLCLHLQNCVSSALPLRSQICNLTLFKIIDFVGSTTSRFSGAKVCCPFAMLSILLLTESCGSLSTIAKAQWRLWSHKHL